MTTYVDIEAFALSLDCASEMDAWAVQKHVRDSFEIEYRSVEPRRDVFTSELIILGAQKAVQVQPRKVGASLRRLFKLSDDDAPNVGDSLGIGDDFSHALLGLYLVGRFVADNVIPLSDHEASVIEALWKNDDKGNAAMCSSALKWTNDLRRARSLATLSRAEFDQAAKNLKHLRCIELEANDHLTRKETVLRTFG